MKKKIYFLGFAFSSLSIFAQVGVSTITPTEKLDVNGTLRIRELPDQGQANSIYTTGTDSSSPTKNQTFTGSKPIVADAQGVLGTTNLYNVVPNNNFFGTDANRTNNTSTAMFVVKRYTLIDATSGAAGVPGTYSTNGLDTNMSVANWQAIISNISFKLTTATTNAGNVFVAGQPYNYRLQGPTGGNWKIVGDLRGLKEEAYVDVLFIKSSIVAAEPRID